MFTFTKDKLIIEVTHPEPMAYVDDLKTALVFALQHLEITEHTSLKELKESNYALLELLKVLVSVER